MDLKVSLPRCDLYDGVSKVSVRRPTYDVEADFDSRKNQLSYLLDFGIDGIITDFPDAYRTTLLRKGYELPPRADEDRVWGCVKKLTKLTAEGLSTAGYVKP